MKKIACVDPVKRYDFPIKPERYNLKSNRVKRINIIANFQLSVSKKKIESPP